MTTLCLDLGSAVMRASRDGSLREHRPGGSGPIRRGAVIDEAALDRSLRRLVPRRSRGRLLVSVPSGAASDAIERTLETARRTLGARGVTAVPAPVAAVRGGRCDAGAVVLDLGAELTEVSWAEPGGLTVGVSLPWGVRDLRRDLLAQVGTRHGIEIDDQLGDHWAGSTVAGRCLSSHAVRVVRITGDDVDEVLAPRVDQVLRLVAGLERARPGAQAARRLVVGGGALVPDLRRRLARDGAAWEVPHDPARTVVAGLATL